MFSSLITAVKNEESCVAIPHLPIINDSNNDWVLTWQHLHIKLLCVENTYPAKEKEGFVATWPLVGARVGSSRREE